MISNNKDSDNTSQSNKVQDESQKQTTSLSQKFKRKALSAGRFGLTTVKWISLYPFYRHFIKTTFSVFTPVKKTVVRDIQFFKKGFRVGSPLKSFKHKAFEVRDELKHFPSDQKEAIDKKGLVGFVMGVKMEPRPLKELKVMMVRYRRLALMSTTLSFLFMFMFWSYDYSFFTDVLILSLIFVSIARACLYVVFGIKAHQSILELTGA